jgi:uncharacterized protein (TIGR03086 family)
MPTETNELCQRHVTVCAGFSRVVASTLGRWDWPSPCQGWSARDVVEHVIGFHDALLLRPLGAKPDRPRDDPLRRWSLTVDAMAELFDRPGLFEATIGVPAVGNNARSQIDARQLVPMLTQDVFIHTWDLARTVGAGDRLDERLCLVYLERLPADDRLVRSGMFGAPIEVPSSADLQSQLLARLGRDPSWAPPDA